MASITDSSHDGIMEYRDASLMEAHAHLEKHPTSISTFQPSEYEKQHPSFSIYSYEIKYYYPIDPDVITLMLSTIDQISDTSPLIGMYVSLFIDELQKHSICKCDTPYLKTILDKMELKATCHQSIKDMHHELWRPDVTRRGGMLEKIPSIKKITEAEYQCIHKLCIIDRLFSTSKVSELKSKIEKAYCQICSICVSAKLLIMMHHIFTVLRIEQPIHDLQTKIQSYVSKTLDTISGIDDEKFFARDSIPVLTISSPEELCYDVMTTTWSKDIMFVLMVFHKDTEEEIVRMQSAESVIVKAYEYLEEKKQERKDVIIRDEDESVIQEHIQAVERAKIGISDAMDQFEWIMSMHPTYIASCY